MSLILTCSFSYGQKCITWFDEEINCEDEQGLKQGYWAYFEESGMIKSDGNYLDNKKIGTWKYRDAVLSVGTYITYNADGRIIEDHSSSDYYKIEINKDSSIMTGYFLDSKDSLGTEGYVTYSQDSIIIYCQNQNCKFTSVTGQELINFQCVNVYNLRFKISRFQMGYFDRSFNIKN